MATDHFEAERLHRYLDARVRGVAPNHDDLDPALVATFERVKALDEQATALDAQSAPEPQLMSNLWRTIVSTSTLTTGQASGAGALRAPIPPSRSQRRGWDRALTFQSLAVAILLVAMLGSLAFGNRIGSGGGNHAALAPPALQDDGSHETAMFLENSARDGVSSETGPLAVPGLAWREALEKTSFSGLQLRYAADGVLVLFDSEAGVLQARSVATGATLWQTETSLEFLSESIIIGGGLVVVSERGYDGSDGVVAAFDLNSGAEVWRNDSSGAAPFSPAIDGGLLIYQSPDLPRRALDLQTGGEAWTLDLAAMSESATGNSDLPDGISGLQSNFVLAVGGGLAYLTLGDGVLYAVDLETQELVWHHDFEATWLQSLAVRGGSLFLTVSRHNPDPTVDDPDGRGLVVRLDAATGEQVWEIASTGDYRLRAVYEKHVVVNSSLLDIETGDEAGTLPDGAHEPVFAAAAIYWIALDGTANAAGYDAASATLTPLWSVYIGVGPEWRAPILADGSFISRGPDGTVMALSESAATPEAETTGDDVAVTDLSGLPPCVAPAPVDWQGIEGEPAGTLETFTEQTVNGTPQPISPGYLYQPWFDFANVPEGDPADVATIEGIRQTIADARICARPGNEIDVSGFFSEDFFRRPWVQERLAMIDQPVLAIVWELVSDWLPPVESATVLEDGRVGVLLDPEPPIVNDFALYFVFVEVNGYWVVDEIIRVGPGALQG